MDPEDQQGLDQQQQQQGQEPPNDGHPAWKEILDVLPDEFHDLVRPTLSKWDKGVQDRFTEFHDQYDPYKDIVTNKVDPELINQSLYILNEIENNPQQVVEHIIKSFDLQYGPLAAQQQQQQAPAPNTNSDPDDDDLDLTDLGDIANNPVFKQMATQLAEMQKWRDDQINSTQQQQQTASFEQYIKGLEEKHGQFDQVYVTALIAGGIDGDEAVKRYQDTINQAAAQLANNGNNNNQQQPPPVVMGGDGTTGSGLPNQEVNVGNMSKNDVNDLVAEMIKRAAEQ